MISFPIGSQLGESSYEFYALDKDLQTRILVEACTTIEEKLADMEYLKRYTHMGKQAFYNDETGGRPSAGWTEHLSDNFVVYLDAGQVNFLMFNNKTVYGKNGLSLNLFDLLWNGWSDYRATSEPHNLSNEDMAYYMRTRKGQQRLRALSTTYTGTMSFYNRQAGRWFYNLVERRGLSAGLQDKFHLYINTAVREGLKEAMESNMSSDAYELMWSL